jgi:hypothetical protein
LTSELNQAVVTPHCLDKGGSWHVTTLILQAVADVDQGSSDVILMLDALDRGELGIVVEHSKMLIRETSGIRIKYSNSNAHVTRRSLHMYWTECYMLEEDILLCHQTAIYTILDRHARIRAKGPKGQRAKVQN